MMGVARFPGDDTLNVSLVHDPIAPPVVVAAATPTTASKTVPVTGPAMLKT